MLTFLFPYLDPWGISGFHNPNYSASQCISFECQLKHLLMQYDSPFLKDPNFTYIAWNIIQKKENSENLQFCSAEQFYCQFCDEIMASIETLFQMLAKWDANVNALPSNNAEKKLLYLLNQLKVISKSV